MTTNIIANAQTSPLIGKLLNNTFTMQYYFIKSALNNYFLISISDSGFRIWHFTSDKKWEPLHNANAFDGFPAAQDVITSLTYANKIITIGDAKANASFQYKDEIINKSFTVSHYFWLVGATAYLMSAKSEQEVSIWNLTANKSWMPLHNAGDFGDFVGAGLTVFDIKFDFVKVELTIGDGDPLTKICADTGFCL